MGKPSIPVKLQISAHKEADRSDAAFDSYDCLMNPSEITHVYELIYTTTQGVGNTNGRGDYLRSKPANFTLPIFIDGTGVIGKQVDVQREVDKFERVTSYNGDIHRPNFLKIAWGTLPVMHCVLKSASIAYKLFSPNGIPLRAVITAAFCGSLADRTRVITAKDKSPDLTHVRQVRGGDNLPGMCFKIYGDPRFYLEVARANRIDDFRRLEPGRKVFFPPLKK
jgi:hypothetical protein